MTGELKGIGGHDASVIISSRIRSGTRGVGFIVSVEGWVMSQYNIPMRSEEEIIKEAHAYRAELDRREERKEIYLMVAERVIRQRSEFGPDEAEAIHKISEAIYQGMIKFCGETK